MPPFELEIAVPGREELVSQDQAGRNGSVNEDSVSSELSLDFLGKERADEQVNDDSKSGSSRWDPDGSDYSLNVLLPPTREESPDGSQRNEQTAAAPVVKGDDSISSKATRGSSLLGTDYSLSKLRSRSKSKNNKTLDSNSCHSTLSVDTFDTEFSVRSKLPENIEVKKPKSGKNRETVVSFYPRVRIQRVPPRKLIPEDQRLAVWYSREEFHVIRKECFNTIRLMKDDDEETDESHPLFDAQDDELCRRGLEYKTPKAYKRRQNQKRVIRNVVFDEMDFQEEQGMSDPEWLATLSRDQSRSCVEAAIESAREDERQARIYLNCETVDDY